MNVKRFKSIKVFEGLFIYLDKKNSPYYQIRIRIPDLKKHIVKSSKTTSLVEAKQLAKEYWKSLSNNYKTSKTNSKLQLKHWCELFIRHLETQKPNGNFRTEYNRLLSEENGLCKWFGLIDVTEFNNIHVLRYF